LVRCPKGGTMVELSKIPREALILQWTNPL
jgi:hypothetical protein